jgi:hypothetical protein
MPLGLPNAIHSVEQRLEVRMSKEEHRQHGLENAVRVCGP